MDSHSGGREVERWSSAYWNSYGEVSFSCRNADIEELSYLGRLRHLVLCLCKRRLLLGGSVGLPLKLLNLLLGLFIGNHLVLALLDSLLDGQDAFPGVGGGLDDLGVDCDNLLVELVLEVGVDLAQGKGPAELEVGRGSIAGLGAIATTNGIVEALVLLCHAELVLAQVDPGVAESVATIDDLAIGLLVGVCCDWWYVG